MQLTRNQQRTVQVSHAAPIMEVVSIYAPLDRSNVRDRPNVGDYHSAPFLYFDFLKGSQFHYCNPALKDLSGKFVVVGGGGPLGVYSNEVRLFSQAHPAGLVAWGLGTNRLGHMAPDYSDLNGYGLVGCRDWGSPFEWVPCVSCMSPLLDEIRKTVPTSQAVVFVHKNRSWWRTGCPEKSNLGDDLESVLRVLASGDVVLTNSYHGAYWATLLGRGVVIADPWSSKFLYMKHRHVMTRWEDAKKSIGRAVRYPNALEECRIANMRFSDKVLEMMGRLDNTEGV